MSNRHNLRKGVAALLSVLSLGSVASAAKPRNNGQNLGASRSGKANPRNNGGKKKLDDSQNFRGGNPSLNKNRNNPNISKGNVISNGPKAQLNENMGYLEHFKAGASDLYGRLRGLPEWQQGLIIAGTLEGISAVTTGKGVVENVSRLTIDRFVDLAREKIFKGPGEEVVNEEYAAREMAEDVVISKLGPIASVFARFAFYLKGSWVDPFVAFVKGLQGEKFSKLGKDYEDVVGKDMNKLQKITFKQFKGFFSEGAWGEAQIVAWWHIVSKGFKPNSLNMWFYELGAKIRGKDVKGFAEVQPTITTTTTTEGGQNPF